MGRILYVAFFLAVRYIRRASIWTNALIVLVMVFTFLNLVVINGILAGLIAGSIKAYEQQYSGNVLISSIITKDVIENTWSSQQSLKKIPYVRAYSPRYVVASRVEANYKERTRTDEVADFVNAQVAGVDPKEDAVTNLSSRIVEGEFLEGGDEGMVVLGSGLLEQYSRIAVPGFQTIAGVRPGSKIRLTIGKAQKEVTVKGVIQSKINGTVNMRVFMNDRELRSILGRATYNVDEIAVSLKSGTYPKDITRLLKDGGYGSYALIQTSKESQGDFLSQIEDTFGILGNVIGAIGLVVASVTIFIIIFINAINRRRYIGILKGIGIAEGAIEVSYIIQAFFYGIIGSGIGLGLLYGVLRPYFDRNPIDFPFSDGILVADYQETIVRVGLIILTTVIAAYIPSRMIVKRNTLNAILGR